MNKKLCIYMVTNEQYESYIPYFFHFLEYAYPEYSCLVAHKGQLSKNVKCLLKYFDGNYRVIEDSFSSYPDDPDTLKCLRWCSYPEQFNLFDYIYIGDIDIWLVKEEPSLLDYHLKICRDNNICYSNTDKIDPPETRGNRMTGLHFFIREPYMKEMHRRIIKYKFLLEKGLIIPEFYNDKFQKIDNQHALWSMIAESCLALPTHSSFRYHGLHLGHSRCSGRWEILFKEDETHREYFRAISQKFNERFWEIFKHTPEKIQKEIELMITTGVKNVY